MKVLLISFEICNRHERVLSKFVHFQGSQAKNVQYMCMYKCYETLLLSLVRWFKRQYCTVTTGTFHLVSESSFLT